MTSICYNYNDANRRKIQSCPFKSFKKLYIPFWYPNCKWTQVETLEAWLSFKYLQAPPFQTELIILQHE